MRCIKNFILPCIYVCYVFMGIILIYANVKHCLNLESRVSYAVPCLYGVVFLNSRQGCCFRRFWNRT